METPENSPKEPQAEESQIPNQECDFLRHAPQEVKAVFDGIPIKRLFSEGECLYRFVLPGQREPLDGLWLPVETYHRLRLAMLQNAVVPTWARSGQASQESQPNQFCTAVLTRPIYGYRGIVKGSPSGSNSCIGQSKIWIPGLSADDLVIRHFMLGSPVPD